MSLADDIIYGRKVDLNKYLQEGESLDDIDDYGFTPIIECAITGRIDVAKELLDRNVLVNKADVTGHTALHWAIDNNNFEIAKLLLQKGADPNAYTTTGLCILVYPILRRQTQLKHLLYQFGAKVDFANDFIYAKLLGHRFELVSSVDILNATGKFVPVDYEGFILEFTVALIQDSLSRFTSSYSTRQFRPYFPVLYNIMDAFALTSELLKLQQQIKLTPEHHDFLTRAIHNSPMLILPAASRGHAIGFIRYQRFWGKIDRGENSLKEGTVNIYEIRYPDRLNSNFLEEFLYKKQSRVFFHEEINEILGLVPVCKLPISAQISGNCSWANIQAIVPVAYAMQELNFENKMPYNSHNALYIYNNWVEWDKDRALDDCITSFYAADPARKASFAAMLAAVLFQACDYEDPMHLERAEKILSILMLPDYHYILQTYLDIYCVKKFTRKGNNLLKILDDFGINPNVGVSPIASGLKVKQKKDKF